ncbi:hydrolytic protein [Actinoplanes teichomyceticus]|uniref:Hydrolytic protein n=1 Tax=Actinoplanes teichomyceticus TaxID=1867 RepID=A0A561WLJ7_ACTTI|nr:hydrolytic protein [Actinoplanes teichomyceticus]TWG24725.1 hypothetical protein FHX34_1021285 [Actinoplanes teichomyceticus]GIF14610.1 hypothetical protein Ate01nite_46420 [Actinoplanes teichomyceticus]
MRASANLGTEYVSLAPGSTATVPVTVRNTGDTVEAYRIEVLGEPAEWAHVEPAEINLYPAGSETVTVTFAPPRSPRVPAGERPFGVRIVPSEHPDATVVQEGVLAIEPFQEVAALLQPGSQSGLRQGRYRVDTDNHGNVAEELTFAAADGTDQVTFALQPAAMTVGNGTRAETRLTVRARRWHWWGPPRESPFTVEIRPEHGRVLTLEGVFVQKPVISAGLLKLLAALLTLLLALLALWFGLVRPAVKSAAKEAVDQNTARQQQAAAENELATTPPDPTPTAAATSAAPGSGSAGRTDSGTAEGGGSGATGSGQGQQFSAAISFRTNKAGSAERSFTVPPRRTFLLTDFLVDNVQGDEGTLRVTANGVPVVTYALENFRNQDYHSVTPIRVPAGARVSMLVTCRTPGTPANASRATQCRESLYLNGLMVRTAAPAASN